MLWRCNPWKPLTHHYSWMTLCKPDLEVFFLFPLSENIHVEWVASPSDTKWKLELFPHDLRNWHRTSQLGPQLPPWFWTWDPLPAELLDIPAWSQENLKDPHVPVIYPTYLPVFIVFCGGSLWNQSPFGCYNQPSPTAPLGALAPGIAGMAGDPGHNDHGYEWWSKGWLCHVYCTNRQTLKEHQNNLTLSKPSSNPTPTLNRQRIPLNRP